MEVTDRKIIEDLIRRRNIRHFDQASDTPLATNETIDQFGFTGSTEIAQKILAGSAPIEELIQDHAARKLLKSFKLKSLPITVSFTADDMMEGYRNWKEQTTTSPSGLHLGHYHALYLPFKYDETKK